MASMVFLLILPLFLILYLRLLCGLLDRHGHWNVLGSSLRRRAYPTIEAGGAFPLHPPFEIVVPMTHDGPTRTESSYHAGDYSQDGDHRKNRYERPDGAVTSVRRVGLLGHHRRRWQLVRKGGHDPGLEFRGGL